MLAPLKIGSYLTKKLIGIGGYGYVVSAVHKVSQKEFAIKLSSERKILEKEYKFLKVLTNYQEFIKIYEYIRLEEYDALVMELMKRDLQYNQSEKTFSLECACAIGLRILDLIEKIHSSDIIHRDIKPSQFLLSIDLKRIHLIDFGMAAYFRKNNVHKGFRTRKSCKGTASYASINNHLGFSQSRRDDLESLCYSLIYLINGALPWNPPSDLKGLKKWNYILEKKVNANQKSFGELPAEFYAMLKYSKSIVYEQTPNYKYIKSLLEKFVDSQNPEAFYDWLNVDKPRYIKDSQIVEGATKITKLKREKKLKKQIYNIQKFRKSKKQKLRVFSKKQFKSIEVLINKSIEEKNICIRRRNKVLYTGSPLNLARDGNISSFTKNVESFIDDPSYQNYNRNMEFLKGMSSIIELEDKKESGMDYLCVNSIAHYSKIYNLLEDVSKEATSKVILPGFKDKKFILNKGIKDASEDNKIKCLII